MNTIDKVSLSANEDSSNDDDLLPEAIEAVIKAEQASVSMIQRRFRVGYNRAARMIDMMEDRGIIGPADGSRPRQVLMNEEELLEMHKRMKDLEI
ncbi:MAG TPA: DNA translocase FtsK [Anaerovoracaceae bacterium]|nr:DNA translocase FtsK [Anaerovoracaceae bacterium]